MNPADGMAGAEMAAAEMEGRLSMAEPEEIGNPDQLCQVSKCLKNE